MWLDNVLKRSWFYNFGLFDLKSLPNSNSLDFQKETWTGGILAEWLSGGLRWAGSCLSWVSIAGIGRGGIGAVAKPELHAIGRRWVALWPFPPLCPSTSSCNTQAFQNLPQLLLRSKAQSQKFIGFGLLVGLGDSMRSSHQILRLRVCSLTASCQCSWNCQLPVSPILILIIILHTIHSTLPFSSQARFWLKYFCILGFGFSTFHRV